MDIRKIKKLIELVENQVSPNWKFLKAKSVRISRSAPAASYRLCSRLMLRR